MELKHANARKSFLPYPPLKSLFHLASVSVDTQTELMFEVCLTMKQKIDKMNLCFKFKYIIAPIPPLFLPSIVTDIVNDNKLFLLFEDMTIRHFAILKVISTT